MTEQHVGKKLPTALATFVAASLVVGTLAGSLSAQDKLSKSDQKWIDDEVSAIITKQEVETFKSLKKDDRKLFKELFWLRRDPNPRTKENEYQDMFEVGIKTADTNFKNFARGRKGHQTDNGKIFLLLGAPTSREGSRQSGMTWTYEPNPGLGIPDGLELTFRSSALGPQLAADEDLENTLDRVRMRTVANPSVSYVRDMEGNLQKASGASDPNSPAKKLLAELVETQTTSDAVKMNMTPAFFKTATGEIFVAMDIRVTEGLSDEDGWIFGQVQTSDGIPVYQFEEKTKLTADGFEMPIQVPPGSYKLYLGAHGESGATFGTTIVELDVPGFEGTELGLSSVVMFESAERVGDVQVVPGKAFMIGGYHFRPKTEMVYTKDQALSGVFSAYNYAKAGEKPNLTLQCKFFREGQARGQTGDEAFMLQADAMALTIFDIPLSIKNFSEPGNYTVELHVTDHVSGSTLKEEIAFVVE